MINKVVGIGRNQLSIKRWESVINKEEPGYSIGQIV